MRRLYKPSNGTEEMYFIAKFCDQCIHEQFMHSQNEYDKTCDILNRASNFNLVDDRYPTEWIYDKKDKPSCTSFEEHHWKKDDNGEWIGPSFEDPNQLRLF